MSINEINAEAKESLRKYFKDSNDVKHGNEGREELTKEEIFQSVAGEIKTSEMKLEQRKQMRNTLQQDAKEAFENGTSVAWANDNTEVIAFSLQNDGYTVGIPSLGSADTIAPAVTKGNTTLLDWINEEIKSLGEENFFHADYEATLTDTYGSEYEESLVVEGGVTDAE
mgnify:CR=1 FL=1